MVDREVPRGDQYDRNELSENIVQVYVFNEHMHTDEREHKPYKRDSQVCDVLSCDLLGFVPEGQYAVKYVAVDRGDQDTNTCGDQDRYVEELHQGDQDRKVDKRAYATHKTEDDELPDQLSMHVHKYISVQSSSLYSSWTYPTPKSSFA